MAPKKRRGHVASTVRSSRTIRGALLTFAGTVGGIFSEAVSVALDAGIQFAGLAPVAGIAAAFGLETKPTMVALAFAGLAMSVFARLDDARTGANAK